MTEWKIISHSISYNIVSEACLATCVLDVATLTAGTILLSTDCFGSVLFSGIFNVKVITVISNLVICMNSTLPLSYPHLVLSLSIIFRYWPEKRQQMCLRFLNRLQNLALMNSAPFLRLHATTRATEGQRSVT